MVHTPPHTHLESAEPRTVLYATAESANHDYLHHVTGAPVVTNARELSALGIEHFTLVPACTGRDLTSITQAAQALQWLKQHSPDRTLLLADPLSNATYAIARMRHHIRALAREAEAIVFVSATVDPFADAELFRRVRLACQFSEDIAVEVAFDDAAHAPNIAWPKPAEVEKKLHKLGKDNICYVRADLYKDPEGHHMGLFKETALRAAAGASAEKARHKAAHGDDGIGTGLLADHGAGFAHSHGNDHEHSHGHSHRHHHH